MILCAGEALIDMLPRQTAAGEAAFAPHAGGAVFNTAIALGRLGENTQFLSGLSTDMFGDILREGLKQSQVSAALSIASDRPTTLAFVKLTDGHASYAFVDENTAGRMITPADLPTLGAEIKALFCGGISLAVEPCAEAYQTLFTQNAAQKLTMIDPNIRPSFIKDADRFRARIEIMLKQADIVKVSDEDLDWLVPDTDKDTQIAALLDMGPKLICYTEGSKGVSGYTARGLCKVPSVKAEVVDTVGAGDTFNAGLLAGLSRQGLLDKDAVADLTDEQLKTALELGAQAAAVTVSRAGANPPWAEELER